MAALGMGRCHQKEEEWAENPNTPGAASTTIACPREGGNARGLVGAEGTVVYYAVAEFLCGRHASWMKDVVSGLLGSVSWVQRGRKFQSQGCRGMQCQGCRGRAKRQGDAMPGCRVSRVLGPS